MRCVSPNATVIEAIASFIMSLAVGVWVFILHVNHPDVDRESSGIQPQLSHIEKFIMFGVFHTFLATLRWCVVGRHSRDDAAPWNDMIDSLWMYDLLLLILWFVAGMVMPICAFLGSTTAQSLSTVDSDAEPIKSHDKALQWGPGRQVVYIFSVVCTMGFVWFAIYLDRIIRLCIYGRSKMRTVATGASDKMELSQMNGQSPARQWEQDQQVVDSALSPVVAFFPSNTR